MRIYLEFPSGAETSATSALSAVSVFDSSGGLVGTYTPTCVGALASDFATTVTATEALGKAYRQHYFEFPIALSANSYRTGVYTYFADPGSGVSVDSDRYLVGIIDPVPEARDIDLLMKTYAVLAALTGTNVVNPTLNERVVYNATIDSNGSVVDSKASILMRFKLYDAGGQSTSVNPVEARVFNSLVNTFIASVLTNSSGTTV